jgi:uncharacterized OB-fold protein
MNGTAIPSTQETQPFWEGVRLGELRYQRCTQCGAVQSYPRKRCLRCHGSELEWRVSSRRGAIASFTIVHRAPTPQFAEYVPYALVLVDLEGFRLMVNLPHDPPEQVAIGRLVEIIFEQRGDAMLPQGKLA